MDIRVGDEFLTQAAAAARTHLPACRPVAPTIGLGAALFVGGSLHWSNDSWRAVMGPAPPGIAHQTMLQKRRFVVSADATGRAVFAAVAPRRLAASWPGFAHAPSTPNAIAALCFTPSRVADFPELAARAYALSPQQRATLAALLASSDLDEAAAQLGLTLAGLRRRMRALFEATGSSRLAVLIANMTRIVADECVSDWARAEGLREALDLTAGEARVAVRLFEGASIPDIAGDLGLSAHTVRDQARAVLGKCGLSRLRDLCLFGAEALALIALAVSDEILHDDREDLLAATRISASGARRIAFTDYGPLDARPVLVFHGGLGTRRVGLALREALQARGFRPIGFDRPGFGLTDMASSRDPFHAGAEDGEHLVRKLGLERLDILAIDGGAAPALEFAARSACRLNSIMLISPRPPRPARSGARLVDQFVRACVDQPALIVGAYRFLRRRGGVALSEMLVRSLIGEHPLDRPLIEDERFRHAMIAELLTCGARTAAGLEAEQTHYPDWRIPSLTPGPRYVLVLGGKDPLWGESNAGEACPWSQLPALERARFAAAGRFIITTHASEIAALLDRPVQTPSLSAP